jgi:dTDP-4-dehydrorhamnose 3,5-epimerase
VSVTDIVGVVLTRPEVHPDDRGHFVEVFRAAQYPDMFVQANHSRSRANVLRGLHYHRRQADLWYVVSGRAQVGLVDLRARGDGPVVDTLVLEGDQPASLYIPAGVAHGFLAMTAVDLIYWVTREYDATDEHGIAWNDPNLGIDWRTQRPIVSARDRQNPDLEWDALPSFS